MPGNNPHRTTTTTPGTSGGPDVDSTATTERIDGDSSGAAQLAADLHCCYTWSGDWNWLVSVWTDARGELLDTQVLNLTGFDVQRENSFQLLFEQVLQQGLQLLNLAVEAGSSKPRGLSITRLGGFYVRECQGMLWLCVLLLPMCLGCLLSMLCSCCEFFVKVEER